MNQTKAVSRAAGSGGKAKAQKEGLWFRIKRDRQLLLLLLPGLLFYAIFRYGPMFGLVIAFKKYSPFLGVAKSPWVGLENFTKFFSTNDFWLLFRNTLTIGVLSLAVTFPATILFALLLNEVRHKFYKKLVQTVSYLPTFLSVVIVCSMTIDILSPNSGIINQILKLLGQDPIYFMTDPKYFRAIYVISGLWSGLGSGAIIYLAALSGTDQSLYEAARIDGCGRIRMMWSITIPSIMPTIITMLILNSANVFRVGQDKILLLYNPMTYEVADVFSTFVYRKAFVENNLSFSAAVGMFESVVCCLVLFVTNKVSEKATGESLW